MCGITGYFSYTKKINSNYFYQAHKLISHRGPDDEGFITKTKNKLEQKYGKDSSYEYSKDNYFEDNKNYSLILGHRRLSIIDLSQNGHQPIIFDDLCLIFNGEIFNYIEIREELKKNGYEFYSDCDSEVFLKAFHNWGSEAFNQFNGMWSAAIYNFKKNNLILTRDRFGIKPLYYSTINEQIIFGSEIKFLRKIEKFDQVDSESVYDYIRYGYVDHTNKTFFKNIYQLEPGNYLEYNKKGILINNFYKLSYQEKSNKKRKIILNGIINSIKLRLRSDVKIGSLLSGGIDSSLILGLIDKFKLTKKIDLFSAVYKEKAFSERSFIDAIFPKNISFKKHYIIPKKEDLIKDIDKLVLIHEEPFRSLGVFSQYKIYEYISKKTKIKVLLNGQGADEIFAGYEKYFFIFLIQLLLNFKLKKFFKEINTYSKERKRNHIFIFFNLTKNFLKLIYSPFNKYSLFIKDFSTGKTKNLSIKKLLSINKFPLKQELLKSVKSASLREYLKYEDKNSMNFSLESRLPFLDYNLVETAFNLPSKYLINDGKLKFILREIAKDYIPKEIYQRKEKMGFTTPQEYWQKDFLKGEFQISFEEISKNGIFDFIDKNSINNIYKDYMNNKFNDWSLIWRIYCLYKWKNLMNIKS